MSDKDPFATAEARPVVFVDRDKTLIEDPGYISDPDQVVLLSGAAKAVTRLRKAGYPVVVVTNQSGIARGMFTEVELVHIHQRMQDLLRAKGADVDAIYYCPYLDGADAKVSAYRRDSDLRKPRPGMLLLAAREMNVDLGASWMVGDSMRDMEAGRLAGCQTVLIGSPDEINGDTPPDYIVSNLGTAADVILGVAADEDVVRPQKEAPPSADAASEAPVASTDGMEPQESPDRESLGDSPPSEMASSPASFEDGAEQGFSAEASPAQGAASSEEMGDTECEGTPVDEGGEPGEESSSWGGGSPVAAVAPAEAGESWPAAVRGEQASGSADTGGILRGQASGTTCSVAVSPPPEPVQEKSETVAQAVPDTSPEVHAEASLAPREVAGPVLEEVVLTPWDGEPSEDGETLEKKVARDSVSPGRASVSEPAERPIKDLRMDLAKKPREGNERIESLLEQLLEETRMVRRSQQHEDFSIGRLAGAIAQAVALCAIGGALYAAVEQTPESASQVTFRLLAGIAFQLMALTWFVASKEK